MRLKTFTADTLPEAMTAIRAALGAEAVILSTTEIRGGGGGVEVVAGLDDGFDATDELAIEQADQDARELGEALQLHRVPEELAERLLFAAGTQRHADEILSLAAAFDSVLRFAPLPGGEAKRGRVVMLMGPPGAGKTATAAKLCALRRVARQRASLITLDLDSAGARDQVRTFAQALNLPLHEARDEAALAAAVAACPTDHLVIVDTAGANPFEPAEMTRLARLRGTAEAEGLLVLPAGGDALESAETAEAFAAAGARLMVASRVDAARRLGGLIAALQAGGLSLAGLGVAPSIGSGLTGVNPVSLARLFLPGALPARASATGTRP